MRTLLVTALVLAPPAIGADFRGTEFGSPYAAVEEREKALGSELLPDNASRSTRYGGYRFRGRAFDRDVRITYICKDGGLALGDYHFPHGKYDDAVVDYLAAYDFLLSVYGAPLFAYASHGDTTARNVIPVVGGATRDEYHATWRTQGLSVHVDLMARGDFAEDNWFAMVVTTALGE